MATAARTGQKTGKLRRLWLNIHLWLGVGLLAAMMPIGLSGSILVWHTPLERSIEADRYAVSQTKAVLAPSSYVDAAQTAFAGRALPTNLRLPEKAGVPVTVVGRMEGPPGPNGRPRQLTAWLDPHTARVTDVAEVAKSTFSVLHRLHGTLLIPNVGRKVVGWLGWGLALSSVTGLMLWWPRTGGFATGLRWTRTPMVFDNLHHLIGFGICLPLAVLALTGVYISFPQTSRALFGQPPAAQRARTPPPALLSDTQLTVDEAVSTAKADAGNAELLSVTFPTAGRDPSWRVELIGAGAPAKVLQVSDAKRSVKSDPAGSAGSAGQDLSRLMRQVHDGAETWPIWQVLVFLGGLAPTALGITGLVMWLRSRRRKAQQKPAYAGE